MQHERLRLAREGKGWSVEELTRRSGVRPRTIEMIERGHFSELPAGLYCRSAIRSYASAVGLDPDEMLDALRPLLPVPEDALDGLARLRGHARKPDPRSHESIVASVNHVPAVAPVVLQAAMERAPAAIFDFAERTGITVGARPLQPVDDDETVILAGQPPRDSDDTLADATLHADITGMDESPLVQLEPPGVEPAALASIELPEREAPGRERGAGREWWRHVAATTIDGALLAGLGCALVWLTAMACGTSIPVALRIAGPAMGLIFALIVTLYFVIFGGLGNATLGVALMRLEAPVPSGRTALSAREVFGRARASLTHIDDSLMAD